MSEPGSSPGVRLLCFEDARGRAVTLLDPYTLNLLRRYDVIDAEALHSAAKELGPGVTKWHRRIYWIGFVVGLYSVGSAVFSRVHSGGGLRFFGIGDVAIVFLFIVFFGCLYVYMRGARRARMRRVRDVMLGHLRCPHCGYDIRGLPTDPEDGATICPECGFAWMLGDSSTNSKYGDSSSDACSIGRPREAG